MELNDYQRRAHQFAMYPEARASVPESAREDERMSEYLDAEIHFTDETVEIRWRESNDKVFGLKMGHDMYNVLERIEPDQRTAVLMEALVYDVDDEGTYWDAT